MQAQVSIDTIWVLVAAFLVFFMNAGFGCLESGFCRAKNAVSILAKNFIVFGIASIAYWAFGFGLMFGHGNPLIGTSGWFLLGADNSPMTGDAYQGIFQSLNWAGVPLMAKFFFHLACAATAASIVSGCVAERVHYVTFIVMSVFITALCYPVTGHWIWGGGWLEQIGMRDFAGSAVVHTVGGWVGLAGILAMGPRIGRYAKNGRVMPIPGHSMALVFLGGMILWLGWFGFNPGRTMSIFADNGITASHIIVVTNLACAAALVVATGVSWILTGKPDFSMTVNGALAGLVAVTASCAFITPTSALIIGALAGVIVVFSVRGFDWMQIDDPVGALSIHLVCGIWGTLCVGLFASTDAPGAIGQNGLFNGGGFSLLGVQALGVIAVGVFTFLASSILWMGLKASVGIRVSPKAEMDGLDLHEMGLESYPHERAINVVSLLEASQLGSYEAEILSDKMVRRVREEVYQQINAKPYSLHISGIEWDEFLNNWRTMCRSASRSSSLFQDVYERFTTLGDKAIHFRGGDPEDTRQKLERFAKDIDVRAQVLFEQDEESVNQAKRVNQE